MGLTGISAFGRIGPVGVVVGAGDDHRTGHGKHAADINATVSRSLEVRHLASVSAIQPLSEEPELGEVGGRRDTASIEAQFASLLLDVL
jgi:hypothetical protein